MPANPATGFAPPRPRTLPARGQHRLARYEHAARLLAARLPANPELFETILDHSHEAAPECGEPWVACEIVVQHLFSPAMWAVFSLQYLLALSAGLRRPEALAKHINGPSDSPHLWK